MAQQIGNIRGEQGSPGPAGAGGWTVGPTAPSGTAAEGTFYLNTSNRDVWQFVGGSWTRRGAFAA